MVKNYFNLTFLGISFAKTSEKLKKIVKTKISKNFKSVHPFFYLSYFSSKFPKNLISIHILINPHPKAPYDPFHKQLRNIEMHKQ
jgi:hypothetical protein